MPRWMMRAGLAACGCSAVLSQKVAAQWRFVPTPAPCETATGILSSGDGSARARLVDLAVITLYVNSAPAGDRYLADALADHLAYHFAHDRGFTSPSREGVRRPPPTEANEVSETARALGVRYLLSGTINGSPTGSELTMLLHDARDGVAIWQGRFALGTSNALAVSRKIRTGVLTRLRGAAYASDSVATGGTFVPAAFEQFLRGLDADRERGPRFFGRAITFFREATKHDPRFAEAYARLALAITRALENGLTDARENPEKLAAEARSAADRAVELDSTFALAWLARATTLSLGKYNPAAQAAFRRAATLDPREPEILWREGRVLLRDGRRAEGERRLRDASALSARFSAAQADLGALALISRKQDVACGWLNEAIASDPYASAAYALRAVARRRDGELRLAWADAEVTTRLGARLLGETAAALVDLSAGDTTKARARSRWVTRELERRSRLSQLEARYVAALFVGLKERERALRAIDKAFPRDGQLSLILQDDVFAPISRDPRYRRATGRTS